METWKMQGSLNQSSQKSESFSVNNLTVSNKAIISELEINDLQLQGKNISCFNQKIKNNLNIENNLFANKKVFIKDELLVDGQIITNGLKVVNNSIFGNLLVNDSIKLKNNLFSKTGNIQTLEGDIISNNNIASLTGNIIAKKGSIIANENIICNKCLVGSEGINTKGQINAFKLILKSDQDKKEDKLVVDGNIVVTGKINCNDIEIKKEKENDIWLHLNNSHYVVNNILPHDKEKIILSSIVPSTYIVKSADDKSFNGPHTYRIYTKIKGHKIKIGGLESEETGIEMGGESNLLNNEFNIIEMKKHSFIELELIYWDGRREFEKKWVLTQKSSKESIQLKYE